MKDEKPAPNGKGMEKYEKNGRLERIEWQPAWPHLLGDLRGTAWVYIMQGTQMGSLLPGSEWTTQTLMMPVLGVKRRWTSLCDWASQGQEQGPRRRQGPGAVGGSRGCALIKVYLNGA